MLVRADWTDYYDFFILEHGLIQCEGVAVVEDTWILAFKDWADSTHFFVPCEDAYNLMQALIELLEIEALRRHTLL
jgi:hypothetical protein